MRLAQLAQLSLSALMFTMPLSASAADAPADDPYLWLEEVEAPKALDWVRAQNAQAEQEFAADRAYEPLRAELLRIVNSRDRIPFVTRMGSHYYNLWRDAANPRGLWRRTPLAEYAKAQPAWEVVLDLDALGKAENINWVWAGADCLRPDTPAQPYRRCLLALSRGGADATVLREFDLVDKAFVQDGFALPEAKQDANWKDLDTLWVASDFGPGSMTTSGYPRTVKEWRRGTPLAAARTVYEGRATDDSVGAYSERESGARRDWVYRSIAFWNTELFVQHDGRLVRVDVPRDASVQVFDDWLLVRTRTPWTVGGQTYPAGALLAVKFEDFMQGGRRLDVLYAPTARSSIDFVGQTQSAVLLAELDNVRPRLWELRHDGKSWQRRRVALPDEGQIGHLSTYWASDDYMFSRQDFTTPTTLMMRTAGGQDTQALRSLPRFFDAGGINTRQFEAISRDGTRIPYFIARREGLNLDGGNPTLLYGYGGFAVTQLPWYSGVFGKGWLERGGVLVLANLRGGGEFGPDWHRAAQRENKQRTWDDFIAVGEDLVKRGFTSPQHLGIQGGSQGGLLVGTAFTQRPDLFGAAIVQIPLFDMLRYHVIGRGASWIGEYGDPRIPEQRKWIEGYSPYQKIVAGVNYPAPFLWASTADDRTHPAHARKGAARLKELGQPYYYFEDTTGGHSGGVDNDQRAKLQALQFVYLMKRLMDASDSE